MELAYTAALTYNVRALLCRPHLRLRFRTSTRFDTTRTTSKWMSGDQRRRKFYIASGDDQAKPLEGFYADILSNPISATTPATRTRPSPPPIESLPKTQKEETLAKARIVFGSRLAGPSERKEDIESRSTMVAGILVPPRPSEPDNCCMSGCVNCVWDIYRDDLEDWAAKSAEARSRQRAQNLVNQTPQNVQGLSSAPEQVSSSMDDDGGGSEIHWNLNTSGSDLFEGVPVGIRQFMMTEKMLKQRRLK